MKEIDIKNHRDTIFPNKLEEAYSDERFFIEVFFEERFFTINLII